MGKSIGGLLGMSKPKMPAPVIVEQPKASDTGIQSEAAAERLRRQKAQGRQSTLVSSLADATEDVQASVRKSTLLGG